MQVAGSTAAIAQTNEVKNNQSVKTAPAQKAPIQEYDKAEISDSARAMMAAAQKGK
ncbi:hypothetical protein [Seleniivibrio sp.]|uniref:hypothetical protein n=1 Tax=Seleniivibrio sp. TaxID=2898801 RepID=UPI0025CED3DB|nr:hypothetical protein [Seleniivibrio sp.]MCD8553702.1 hypothetical protein [Seleniivibrio sp.]